VFGVHRDEHRLPSFFPQSEQKWFRATRRLDLLSLTRILKPTLDVVPPPVAEPDRPHMERGGNEVTAHPDAHDPWPPIPAVDDTKHVSSGQASQVFHQRCTARHGYEGSRFRWIVNDIPYGNIGSVKETATVTVSGIPFRQLPSRRGIRYRLHLDSAPGKLGPMELVVPTSRDICRRDAIERSFAARTDAR
jgi:hypothetical protein